MPKKSLLAETLAWLEKTGRQSVREGMARYAIPSEHAFGIPVGTLRQRAKKLGRNHELALSLWKTGHYEARMLATFVDDPSLVTPEQMDAWCRKRVQTAQKGSVRAAQAPGERRGLTRPGWVPMFAYLVR